MFFLPTARTLVLATLPALAATTALAQQTYTEIDDDARTIAPFGLTLDRLEEMDLRAPDGRRLGEIEDVLADPSGAPAALAIEIERGGADDDREVILPLDQVTLTDGTLVTDIAPDTLVTLPAWER